MHTYKKPLGRSIATGCIIFMLVLCIALSVLNYFNQKNALYQRYQSYITDILRYVDSRIDDEDLKQCIETGVESEKYKETLLFMDGIMNDFSIHYLYAIKPINHNETGNVMSVFCAEDDYNRYVDTEGNLYLGWISDEEYDAATVNDLFKIMEQDDIVFFTEKTGWSTDYTGALPLRGEDGEAYAILAVDVDITMLSKELWSLAARNSTLIMLIGIIFTMLFLLWTRSNVTNPIHLLENGVVDFVGRSRGQRDVEALKFEEPVIEQDNEVKSLSKAITQMTEDMREYVTDILNAEEKTRDMKELADAMSELATADSLTGIRNKTAFSREIGKLEQELADHADAAGKKSGAEFGMAMIDLNFLKVINDTYGHDKGDEAICALSRLTCRVFAHSPVFRVGGDEFIVLLRGRDYNDIESLREEFIENIEPTLQGEEPWKHVSAAIGVALYDADIDKCVDDVMRRADEAMYRMKKDMKAERK